MAASEGTATDLGTHAQHEGANQVKDATSKQLEQERQRNPLKELKQKV